ncbi:MAG: 16S rRNA (uracil(1498)-N(3))-methyltransferase [Sneathiellaceae bacterium]
MAALRHLIRTRLHVDAPLSAGAALALPADRAHYLGRVLRLEAGAAVRLFNGRDGEWQARIAALGKREVALTVEELLRPQPAPAGPVLAFAPIRRQRMDWLLEKATELGAGRLQPVLTAFAQTKELRADRAGTIVQEAAEQCERLDLPDIATALSLAGFLAAWPADRPLLFCDEAGAGGTAGAGPAGLPAGAGPPAVLVGPEGGFAEAERAAVLAHPAARPLDLGPLILRAETAGIAALALLAAGRRVA